MIKGKGTSKPYIQFLGNSATDVTGSMHLVRFKKYVTLLDCGLIQLNDPMTSYKANVEQLRKLKPTEIDYIILSHLHIDHSGLIPALFARGCHAHVYVPIGSIPFLKLLWLDSMKIMQSDAIKLQNKHNIKASAFYNEDDIDKALMRCIEVDYYELHKINEDMEFRYYPAGHIINSAQVYLVMHEGSVTKRVGYTGDIGGNAYRVYTEPRTNLPFCDILVGENTYNIPTRPNKHKDRANDLLKIETIVEQSNKILIPTFSLGRTQELLTVLYQLWEDGKIDNVPVYLDSPLSQKICDIWYKIDDIDCEIWYKVWHWKNLRIINDWAGSMALQNRDEHCIILSASGFLTGGRALSHLKTLLPSPHNHVIFVGYAGENNLASQIKSKQREVNVDGIIVDNNANITELRSFSSHASYEELMEYYTTVNFNKICVVHGEQEGKVEFCKVLQNKLVEQGKSARVVCVNDGQRIFI